jgi:hypothetical protein
VGEERLRRFGGRPRRRRDAVEGDAGLETTLDYARSDDVGQERYILGGYA